MNQTLSNSFSSTKSTVQAKDRRAARLMGLAGLSALILASRIPFASQVLYHWDSVNFAFAMSDFNLAKEQPQPPGYILYVWLTRLLDSFLHNPQTVMVTISIAASVGAVIAMFLLGEAMYNERVGWLSAGFLAVSPLFWFYGEIALPHTLDAFLVILSALFLYRTMQGEKQYVFPVVILLAIAGGVRQQTLVFLAPLLLFAFRKIGWRLFIGAGVVGIIACLLWFVPLINLSGGLKQYLAVMKDFSDRFQQTTSIFMGAGLFGLRRNATKLILYSAYGWGIFFVPFAYAAVRKLGEWRKIRLEARAIFIGLWVLPAVLFYLLVHMGQQGLIFVFLPALLLVSAAAFDSIVQGQAKFVLVGGLAIILLSSAIFLFLPEYPLGANSQRLLTRQTLVNSDRYFSTRFEAIRKTFPASNTLILAENWHHVQYYLPEYRVIPFNLGAKWEIDEGAPVDNTGDIGTGTAADWGLQAGKAQIVIFDPALDGFVDAQDNVNTIPLGGQDAMKVMDFPSQAVFTVSADSFGVEVR